MKLIDEKEVEAKLDGALAKYDIGFRCGVDFAEQKLLLMMVEFAEWCERKYSSRVFPDSTVLWNLNGSNFTTEQLLEQFKKNELK